MLQLVGKTEVLKSFFLILIFSCPLILGANPTMVQSLSQKQINDTLALAQEWFKKAGSFDRDGQIEKGNEAAREALRLAAAIKDYLLMGRSMNFLAINLSEQGKRKEGIELSFLAFENLMLAGDTVRASNVKINIGMDYANQGNYEDALKIELEALEIRLQSGDSTNIATFYQHIGEVYKELGIREKWKSFVEIAHHLAENPKYASFNTQIGILNDLGGIYQAESQSPKAAKIYLSMYEKSKNENYLKGMATALNNLSNVYLSLGQNGKALEVTKESLEINQRIHNYYGCLCAQNQLGEVFLKMKQPVLSHQSFLKGLELAEKQAYQHEKLISLDGLFRSARQQENWREAILYKEKHEVLKDSLQSIDLQQKLSDIETKYQTEKKENQIVLLSRDNELKNNRLQFQKLALSGGSLFFLCMAAIVFFTVRQNRRRQIDKQNELEQKLLRSQMNPHFIFNSLGAIQLYMMKNEGRKAAFYLSSFSSLMRSILNNSRQEMITLEEEKQTLENYLHLHQLRLGERLSFTVYISEKLDAATIILPPMLVQPFVENAIVHGVEALEKQGTVDVRFDKINNQLVISVADNGKGIGNNSQTDHRVSYALQIFKERIAILKKSLKMNISYSFEPLKSDIHTDTGTLVKVFLPLNFNSHD